MEDQLSVTARQQLDRFCRQFLQLQLDLDYPDDEHLRKAEFQDAIFARLFREGAVQYAQPLRYQIKVLKELIRRIEQSIIDWEEEGVSDDLMDYFSSLIASNVPSEVIAAQQKSYVTYTLSSFPSDNHVSPEITLFEARNLISGAGTTGLRTWEAALRLGDYLCANKQLVEGKSVLELGAGTGYVSILCAKYLKASHVIASDGSDDVVAELPTNFFLNGLQDTSHIVAKELRWGHALMGSEHPEWNEGRPIDVVIGADITYDDSVVRSLVGSFDELSTLHPGVTILVAATVRNPKTLEKFVEFCRIKKYHIEEESLVVPEPAAQQGPFYSNKIPILIYRISKS
ncbi:putative methyltransferase-domain-containing protein [Xylogone sp. PMI_703]|nr:putative methyltransferase-domain-containing protein [Xylogone sp. PMI_703]